MRADNFAVIDMGTNTFHLMIASISNQGIAVLYKEKRSVRLGEGGISVGVITQAAKQRAITSLSNFKATIAKYPVAETFASATSAVRNAANSKSFLEDVLAATGLHINIISGHLEAQLIYEGVRQSMNLGEKTSLIMDIGGGSVEFILCNHNQILWKESFEIGGQRLMDQFHQEDPIMNHNILAQKQYLQEKLQRLQEACKMYPPDVLVGASGSFDSLMSIDNLGKNNEYDLEAITEYWLDKASFLNIHQLLLPLNRAKRLEIPGMIELRADMIVVASILIDFILHTLELHKIRISSYALKEGILNRLARNIPIENTEGNQK
jgi:exopolyphosphatase/guanosine-5'-triphosphate,3'-diphosphate pyrophosphatase